MPKPRKGRTAKITYVTARGCSVQRTVLLGAYAKGDWQAEYDKRAELIARFEKKWKRPWPLQDLTLDAS